MKLLVGRRAILIDLNPFAIFLTRNTIAPIDLTKLRDAYEEVLNREVNQKMETITDKTIVREILNSLYTTKCSCGSDAEVIYYVWDTFYKLKKIKVKLGGTAAVILDVIKKLMKLQTYPEEINQLWLNENWKHVLDLSEKDVLELTEPMGVSESVVA